MSQKQDRFNKRRLRSSYISVVVSMTLVLFLMGLLSTVLFHSKAIANQVKENIAFTVLLKPDSKQIMVKQFQRQLKLSEHVKNTEFISKNEAIETLKEDLGEDFIKFLGFNPLSDAIDIHFQAYYTQTNSPEKIEKELNDMKSNLLINLASNEYYDSVQSLSNNINVVSPVFKDKGKDGKFKIISFYAKKARGYMASWLVKNKIKKEQDIHSFSEEGYSFSIEESSNGVPTFLRG